MKVELRKTHEALFTARRTPAFVDVPPRSHLVRT